MTSLGSVLQKQEIKSIYDAVHRFIRIDPLESLLINSRPFQRLRYIHQLGVTFFIYPGATHSRLEHSLGVMELASRIYDRITSEEDHFTPKQGSLEHTYWRRILRLSALCHDLGHLPFSHVAEKFLLGEDGHEKWTKEIIESSYLSEVLEKLQVEYSDRDVKEDILKIALGEEKFLALSEKSTLFTPWEQIVTAMVTGDFFGADRIDYLLRDAKSTGLAYGLFDYDQLIETLKIIPSNNEKKPLTLGVKLSGIEACEALLLSRYYMHKRLYQYPKVKAYSLHLARFMKAVYPDLGQHLDRYIATTDNEVLTELNIASQDLEHRGHFDAKCLYLRDNRFRAIPFNSFLSQEERDQIEQKLSISKIEIEWEIAKESNKKSSPFSFSVLLEDGTIERGDNCSELSIPKADRHWVYVAPQYEQIMRKHLKERECFR